MNEYQLEIVCYEARIAEDYVWVKPQQLNIPLELLNKLDELGIIEICEEGIRSDHVQRIFKALRLHRTLGVNLAGVGIILKLLEEIERLRDEIEKLKKGG